MHLPRWLRIISVLVVLNATLVCWSVIQHHFFASASAQETLIEKDRDENDPIGSTEFSGPNGISGPNETDLRQRTSLVPPVIQEVVNSSIPENDPLLSEIRRQAANQFGEISGAGDSGSTAATLMPLASQANPISVDELQLLQLRLQIVVKMSQAAQQLSEIAILQKQTGQPEQAEATLARIERLTTLMQEMLSD